MEAAAEFSPKDGLTTRHGHLADTQETLIANSNWARFIHPMPSVSPAPTGDPRRATTAAYAGLPRRPE